MPAVRPWQHAVSSLAGRPATDSALWGSLLALHEFLDISKAGCADKRHRIMLHHHDLGGRIAAQGFPSLNDVDGLVRQHVREDLGHEASFADWMDCVDIPALPLPIFRRIAGGPEGVANMVITHLPAERSEAAHRVAQLLFLPKAHAPDLPDSCLAVLMNSVGPFVVRQVMGPPVIEWIGGRRVVTDWGWIAEAVIMACFGRIPDLREIVACVKGEP